MLKTLMIFWDHWGQVEDIFRALVKEDPREMKQMVMEGMKAGASDDPAEDHDMGKYACLSCDRSFRGTPNLRRHVKLVHEARMIPVSCPSCPR